MECLQTALCGEAEKPAEKLRSSRERDMKHQGDEKALSGQREKSGDCFWVSKLVHGRNLGVFVRERSSRRGDMKPSGSVPSWKGGGSSSIRQNCLCAGELWDV